MTRTYRCRRWKQMQRSNEENGKEVLGFCSYCKREVIKDAPDTLIRKHKAWHEFCWEQKYNRPKECKF